MTRALCAAVIAASVATAAAQPVPAQLLLRGAQSVIEEPREVLARTDRDYQILWRQHAGDDNGRPAVDFASRMVIAVFAGSRPTPGHQVEATVEDRGGELVVTWSVTGPPADAILAQVITQPFLLLSVPRTEGSVRFVRR